jgi:hypothetical protein
MAEAEETSGVDASREWSDAELTELGNMLMLGLSIEEIRATSAPGLRRGPGQSCGGGPGLPRVCRHQSLDRQVIGQQTCAPSRFSLQHSPEGYRIVHHQHDCRALMAERLGRSHQ